MARSSPARAFLDAARDDRFESLYVLAISTGLRRGELLGFRWKDVDLERRTLRVGRALVRERLFASSSVLSLESGTGRWKEELK